MPSGRVAYGVLVVLLACGGGGGRGGPVVPPPPSNPVITGVTPSQVTPGEGATITGSNFGSDPTRITVTFGGIAVLVGSATSDRVVVTVPLSLPLGTTTVEVSVTGVATRATATVTVGLPSPRPSPAAAWRATSAGPQRWAPASTFLSAPWCRALVFGGTYQGSDFDTTFLFDPAAGTWREVAGATRPSARRDAGLSWDLLRGRAILTGGVGAGGETWSFDPATESWQMLTFTLPGRCCHGQVYSSVLQRTLVFGGFAAGHLADTWALAPDGWRQIETRGAPTPRRGFGMAEDAPSGRIVLYGGSDGPNVLSDTWIFEPATSTWSQIPIPAGPPGAAPGPRWVMAMSYSPSLQGVVLYGGRSGDFTLAPNDSWVFDMRALRWVRVMTPASPPARSDAELVADTCSRSNVLVGALGSIGNPVPPAEDLTWILE